MTFSVPVERNVMAESRRLLNSTENKTSVTDLSRVSLYSIALGSYDDANVFFDDMNGLSLSGSRYDPQFSTQVHLDVEDAKRLKTGTKAVLVVRFEEPYAITRYAGAGQFQVRLIDVQFFDPQTGKVLAKLGSASSPKANTSSPARKNVTLEKAQELYNARRDAEALAELQRLLRDEPANAEAFLLVGRIKLQQDQQDEAIAALKTAIFWDASLIDGHILLARIYLARGATADAKKYVNAALALDPTNQEAISLQRQIRN
jgi:tetratricopeptide (TPR) repeat protein